MMRRAGTLLSFMLLLNIGMNTASILQGGGVALPFEFVGCYEPGILSGSCGMTSAPFTAGDMSTSKAITHCDFRNYDYMAVSGQSLWCGNRWTFEACSPFRRDAALCNTVCPGNGAQTCGGADHWSVYHVGHSVWFESASVQDLIVNLDKPTHDKHLKFRLDARKLFHVLAGGFIRRWEDETALGGPNHGEALSTPPRWFPFHGYIRFDAAAKLQITTDRDEFRQPQTGGGCGGAFSAFVVVKTSDVGTHDVLRAQSAAGDTVWTVQKQGDTVTSRGHCHPAPCAAGAAVGSRAQGANGTIVSVTWGDDGTLRQWLDGEAAGAQSGLSTTLCGDRLEVGGSGAAAAGGWMNVGQLLLFRSALSDGDRVRVESYLAERHGIDAHGVFTTPQLSIHLDSGQAPVVGGSDAARGAYSVVKHGSVTFSSDAPRAGVHAFVLASSAYLQLSGHSPVLRHSGYTVRMWYKYPRFGGSSWRCILCNDGNRGLEIHGNGNALYLWGQRLEGSFGGNNAGWHLLQVRVERYRQEVVLVNAQTGRLQHSVYRRRDITQIVRRVLRGQDHVGSFRLFSRPLPMWHLWAAAYAECGPVVADLSPPPAFSPGGGEFQMDVSPEYIKVTVTISVPYAAFIHYTEDGSVPTCSSSRYLSPIDVRSLGVFIIKAIACQCTATATRTSAVTTHTYALWGARDAAFLVLSEKEDVQDMTYDPKWARWEAGMYRCIAIAHYHPAPLLNIDIVNSSTLTPSPALLQHSLATNFVSNGTFCFPVPDLPRGRFYRVRVSSVAQPEYHGYGDLWAIHVNPNLALGKPTSASSEHWGGHDGGWSHAAHLAADGLLIPRSIGGRVWHSSWNYRPWWTVDLGAVYSVGYLRLHADSWHSGHCHPYHTPEFIRMHGNGFIHHTNARHGLFIEVADDSGDYVDCVNTTHVWRPDYWKHSGYALLPCYKRLRYVRYRSTNWDHAMLTEMEVLGRHEDVCGDGIRQASEECDDGNIWSTDGCSTLCTVEHGWQCSGGEGGHAKDVCHGTMCYQHCPSNGVCEDGGPGSVADYCVYGHDCADCGPRCAGEDLIGIHPHPVGNCYFTWKRNTVGMWSAWGHSRRQHGIGSYGDWAMQNTLQRPYTTPFLWNRYAYDTGHHSHYVWLQLGRGRFPSQWRWPGYQTHRGHVVMKVRLFWLKHTSRGDSLHLRIRNQYHRYFHLRYNLDKRSPQWGRPADGVLELEGWPQETTLLVLYTNPGFQTGLRLLQVFGAPVPSFNVKYYNSYHRPEVMPIIQGGGAFTYLTTSKVFTDSCLFRGNKAWVRRCVIPDAQGCGHEPWQGYFFPHARMFTVPGLTLNVEFRIELTAMFESNIGGTYLQETITPTDLARPSRARNLTVLNITGGAVGLRWSPPNDTGGLPIEEYWVFAAQRKRHWHQPKEGAVRLPFGTVDLGLREGLVDGSGNTSWHYAHALTSLTLEAVVPALAASTTYRFCVMAINRLSRCLVSNPLQYVSPFVEVNTSAATAPDPPVLSLVNATGGAMNFDIERPADTGGVPTTAYHVQTMVPSADLSLFLATHDDEDECRRSRRPCHAQQTCTNLFLSYNCSACPPLHTETVGPDGHDCIPYVRKPPLPLHVCSPRLVSPLLPSLLTRRHQPLTPPSLPRPSLSPPPS